MSTKNEYPNLSSVVATLLKQQGGSLRSHSLKMGQASNYLSTNLRANNPRISLLIELSNALDYNLLEAYRPFLKPEVASTAVERDLKQKMNDLTAELLRVTEEKDRYWAVIASKAG